MILLKKYDRLALVSLNIAKGESMSVDIVVKQNGLFKKTLPLEVILGGELKFGVMEIGCRLKPDVLGAGEFIVYQPECIGRGISVEWRQGEKKNVILRMLSPTSNEEIDALYRIVERIAKYWNCDIEMDGSKIGAQQFFKTREGIKQFNIDVLKNMSQKIIDEDSGAMTLFSTMWPLALGKAEAERFLKEPETYGKWLHEKQVQDLYYAVPRFYKDDKGHVLGRFAITEGVDSIIPIKPEVPFGTVDPDTQKALECSDYAVALFSCTYDKIIGEISYDKFITFAPMNKLSAYDGANYVLGGLSLKEMETLINVQ